MNRLDEGGKGHKQVIFREKCWENVGEIVNANAQVATPSRGEWRNGTEIMKSAVIKIFPISTWFSKEKNKK